MKRIFLDANVMFTAAHNPDGKASFVIELGTVGIWKIYTSTYALEEAYRNLEVKFPDCQERLRVLTGNIEVITTHRNHPCPPELNVKDKVIFQAAMECNVTHLLTGDLKDFGRYMNQPEKTSGVIIQTVADFLKKL